MDKIVLPPRIAGGDFAGWLRDGMAARRMSTRMLGLRTGIHYSTICRLTVGSQQPNLPTALALLRVLGEGSDDAQSASAESSLSHS
jgi:hypothetical protein